MRLGHALAGGLVLLGAGCANDFAPESYVSDLRLITIVADPPELSDAPPTPWQTTMTALWANPGGGAPTFAWSVCTRPALPQEGEIAYACAAADAGAPTVLPLGGDVRDDAAFTDSIRWTVPDMEATQLATTPFGLPDNTDGFYLPVRLDLTAAGAAVTSFYRLRYHFDNPAENNAPNSNPLLSGITLAPAKDSPASDETLFVAAPINTPVGMVSPASPMRVSATSQVNLRAQAVPGAAESYLSQNGDPLQAPTPKTETLSVLWYTTGGNFDHDDTGVDGNAQLTFKKRPPQSGQTVDLWVVLKDDRGGNSVLYVPKALQLD